MGSLADLPELVGFFSYSREDDEDSHGALSALRERIQRELRGQLGRSMKTFRLWQDKEAIAAGKLWEAEIKTAVGQSVFFIPIITPTVVRSPYCRFELEAFLAREAELGRDDLVFPMLYIKVPELEDSARRKDDVVLSIIAKRQYLDWREFRHRDIHSTDVKETLERFCAQICETLRRYYLTPEESKQQEATAALERAEAERQRQAADARGHVEEEARQQTAEQERQKREVEAVRSRIAELEAKAREEEVRRQREVEAEQRRKEHAEAERRKIEEGQRRRKEEEQQRRRKVTAPEQRHQEERFPAGGSTTHDPGSGVKEREGRLAHLDILRRFGADNIWLRVSTYLLVPLCILGFFVWYVWQPTPPTPVLTIEAGLVHSIAFSPDGAVGSTHFGVEGMEGEIEILKA
jgi:hypothetical protein